METVKNNYEKLVTYSEQIVSILDDYKKSYIYYNTNPDNQDYAKMFSIDSGNLTALNKNLFVTTNDIQKDIDELNKKISELDKRLVKEKALNGELLSKLQQLEGKGNGSQVMNSNSKEMYEKQYISNWNIFIGIFIIIGMLASVFRKSYAASQSSSSSLTSRNTR